MNPSLETSANIDIKADASSIWALLTNEADFSRNYSTIISVDDKIKKSEKIKLDEKRIFRNIPTIEGPINFKIERANFVIKGTCANCNH